MGKPKTLTFDTFENKGLSKTPVATHDLDQDRVFRNNKHKKQRQEQKEKRQESKKNEIQKGEV